MRSHFLVLCLALFCIYYGCHYSRQELPLDARSSCNSVIDTSQFNPWFEKREASLNGSVKPPHGLSFQGGPACNFYKWSEQIFLWLTSPAPTRYSENNIVMNTSGFFDISERDSSGEREFIAHGPERLRFANVLAMQSEYPDTPGVLMAQNGSLVYSTISVNQVFTYFRTRLGPSILHAVRFPTDRTEIDSLHRYVGQWKKSLPDSEALAVGIQCSWVATTALIDEDNFIRMKAVIPKYENTNPRRWKLIGRDTVELALVGMNIFGSVAGHPEMLWTTFEHVSNLPAASYSYSTANGERTKDINTHGKWIFCSSGAESSDVKPRMHLIGSDIVGAPLIQPGNLVRKTPWGRSVDPKNIVGNSEVIEINNSVRSLLDPRDVRINYVQIGTTWESGGEGTTSRIQPPLSKLSNSTTETYRQGSNCFDCHSTRKMSVSEMFSSVKPLSF
jgi:hypothetical protein